MTTHDTVPAIERSFTLRSPRSRVWRAITAANEVATWWCNRADIPLEVGAVGWMEWDAHGRFAVRVERLEPESHFAWRGARDPDTDVDDGPTTLVEWWLADAPGGGTVVRLRESGFVAPDERRLNTGGWLHAFGALARHLADEPWQAGITRTHHLASPPERVWRAFTEPDELRAWWAGGGTIDLRSGFEGWFEWPGEGRFAMRVEAVEPPSYVAWSWATEPDRPLAASREVLRTEWAIMPAADGGTDLHLLETGFAGPEGHRMNDAGWDGDVLPGLRRLLGEPAAATDG